VPEPGKGSVVGGPVIGSVATPSASSRGRDWPGTASVVIGSGSRAVGVQDAPSPPGCRRLRRVEGGSAGSSGPTDRRSPIVVPPGLGSVMSLD
jgi:hypothetical protein